MIAWAGYFCFVTNAKYLRAVRNRLGQTRNSNSDENDESVVVTLCYMI